jgi:hypothetical protein
VRNFKPSGLVALNAGFPLLCDPVRQPTNLERISDSSMWCFFVVLDEDYRFFVGELPAELACRYRQENTNAAVKFEPGHVILTVPATEAGAKPERTAPGLSKDSSKAGISHLAGMREWKAAIASVIRSGVAEGNWLVPLHHRVRAEASLSQTSCVVPLPQIGVFICAATGLIDFSAFKEWMEAWVRDWDAVWVRRN